MLRCIFLCSLAGLIGVGGVGCVQVGVDRERAKEEREVNVRVEEALWEFFHELDRDSKTLGAN